MPEARERLSGAVLPWLIQPLLAVWLAATALKETPLFWRNAGGYPLGLRAAVLDGYYPLTGLLIAGCAGGFAHWLLSRGAHRRTTALGWLLVALALGAGLALLGANNLVNLLEGFPLHHHNPL